MNPTEKLVCETCSGRGCIEEDDSQCEACKGLGSNQPLPVMLADASGNIAEMLCDVVNAGDADYPEATARRFLDHLGDFQHLPALVAALEKIRAGCENTGRWLDQTGNECGEGDAGAEWFPYTEEENECWLDTINTIAADALKLLSNPSR